MGLNFVFIFSSPFKFFSRFIIINQNHRHWLNHPKFQISNIFKTTKIIKIFQILNSLHPNQVIKRLKISLVLDQNFWCVLRKRTSSLKLISTTTGLCCSTRGSTFKFQIVLVHVLEGTPNSVCVAHFLNHLKRE